MISINLSLVVEIIIFLVLMFTLDKIFYKPVLAKINEREKRLDEDKSLIEETTQKENQLQKEIQTILAQTKRKSLEIIYVETKTAENENHQLIAEAVERAAKAIDQHKKVVQQQIQQTTQEIKKEVPLVTKEIIKKIIPLFIFALCLFSSSLHASETTLPSHSNHATHESHESKSQSLPRVINFIIMVSILTYIIQPTVKKALAQRTQQIKQTLDETKTTLNSVLAALEQCKKERETIESISQKQIEDARLKAEKRKMQILESGRKEAESILQDIESQKMHYIEEVKKQLKEQLVTEVISTLENTFQDGIDKETDRRLVQDCILKLDSVSQLLRG